ncbi:hypothetical protein EON65_57815 [archaeon]|nr:MAG: hypothetical protein EON65_57815 [archaeon]
MDDLYILPSLPYYSITNAAGYVKVLGDNLVPVIQEYFQYRPCIFQQDNAAVHTAHEVTSFFRAHNIQVLPGLAFALS